VHKKRRKLRIVLISIGAVLAVLIAGVGVYALSIVQRIDSVEKIDEPFPDDALRPPVTHMEGPAPENILLLGSDTRGSISGTLAGAKGTRSDTIMVVHIPADRKSIQVMSLMRDFWVDIPGHGKAKLNAALAYGGIPLAVQTIEGIIGSRIDHVAIIDFEGFKGMTDALGGVTLDNPIAFNPTHLPGAHFAKGKLSLDGEEALAFVRERYAFVDGDYQRVRNQQLFIKAMMGKILSRDTLTNPATISNLVGEITPFMAVDSGLNSNYAISMGLALSTLRVGDVRFFTMPTLGTGMEGSQSVVKVNWDEVPKIQQAFKSDTLDSYVLPTRP
jgi:LCP family protein required for cell wall assembly